jgi:catechol 2,3-dioxygenase-like lactoylglutathione lyase family enzyme
VIITGPFREFDLRAALRLQPAAFFISSVRHHVVYDILWVLMGIQQFESSHSSAHTTPAIQRKDTTMAIKLNHTIVAAHDKSASARFLSEILRLPPPSPIGPFAVVPISDDTSLDYMDTDGPITSQHYAFLVEEIEFDEIFERIRERRLSYWADPGRQERDQINTWDGGRGLYFDDPNGHLLEIITRPYGSGGTTESRPHPLFAGLSPEERQRRRRGH